MSDPGRGKMAVARAWVYDLGRGCRKHPVPRTRRTRVSITLAEHADRFSRSGPFTIWPWIVKRTVSRAMDSWHNCVGRDSCRRVVIYHVLIHPLRGAYSSRIVAQERISNDAILSVSSVKTKSSSIGLPGKFPSHKETFNSAQDRHSAPIVCNAAGFSQKKSPPKGSRSKAGLLTRPRQRSGLLFRDFAT